jgi:FAD:protein FMN transferase
VRRSPASIALVVVCFALAPRAASAATARDGQVVMGTVLEVTVVADDEGAARAMAADAIAEARRWDDALTIWRRDGELARLNARAGRGPLSVGSRLRQGLAAMLKLASDTGGAFAPTVAMLRGPGGSRGGVPGIAGVLELSTDRAALAEGAALDPGGIGKGLALDAIVARLRSAGAKAAFLDFGGSSQTAIGVSPGDARGWTVLVSGLAAGSSLGTLRLRDASVSTSRSGAVDTTPILDPRSGRPVPGPRLATVVTPDATAADAWSTALVVLGRSGEGLATEHGIEALVEDGNGRILSKGFPLEPAGSGRAGQK